MPTTYSPTAAAGLLGISVSSLRTWCAQFAVALSDGASPGPGVERKLNDTDIAILLRVKELRAQGMPTEAIVTALHGEDTASLQPYIDATATATTTLAESPTAPLQQPPAQLDIIAAFSAIQTQIQTLQTTQREDHQARAGQVTSYMLGLLSGLLLCVLIMLIVWIVGGR